ncbi:MAG: hypothetical protein IPN13_16535 [Bacteroidetes bacterium]|nr:hypothetical protein [Bacteroidota bacterium]
MKRTLHILRLTVFGLALLFIGISVFTVAFVQNIPYEFDNIKVSASFYECIFFGLPSAVLLTLVWTVKRRNTAVRNIGIGIITFLSTAFTFWFLYSNIFSLGFGSWTDFNIAYESKDNPKIRIVEQRYDEGALGYGGWRTVKLTPFLSIFNHVENIDTNKIDTTKWNLVNKEGDVRFP